MSRPPTVEDDARRISTWYGKGLARADKKKYVRREDIDKWLKMADRYSDERAVAIDTFLRQLANKKTAETNARKKKRLRKEALAKAQLSLV